MTWCFRISSVCQPHVEKKNEKRALHSVHRVHSLVEQKKKGQKKSTYQSPVQSSHGTRRVRIRLKRVTLHPDKRRKKSLMETTLIVHVQTTNTTLCPHDLSNRITTCPHPHYAKHACLQPQEEALPVRQQQQPLQPPPRN